MKPEPESQLAPPHYFFCILLIDGEGPSNGLGLGRRHGEAAEDHIRAGGESSRLFLHRHEDEIIIFIILFLESDQNVK